MMERMQSKGTLFIDQLSCPSRTTGKTIALTRWTFFSNVMLLLLNMLSTDVQDGLLDSVGEGEGGMFRENSIEICILSMVKQITSPGWMHEKSARAWCTGKTQRDRVEREVGGGIGMGYTCKSMADSCQCLTKLTTIL